MPRRKSMRKVVAPPGFRGYKPYGNRQGRKEHVDLLFEEYEAIKLAEYDLMNLWCRPWLQNNLGSTSFLDPPLPLIFGSFPTAQQRGTFLIAIS